nr:F-box and FNIP repeat domain containing protein [Mimivirus sp.]
MFVDNNEPSQLLNLILSPHFNQPLVKYDATNGCIIKKFLPPNIKKIKFSSLFNQSIIGAIPENVTHLIFGEKFNQPIENSIPNNVTHLTFGPYFNQPIKDCIPDSVTHLTFGNSFNQSIIGCIPNKIIYLKFGTDFNQSIYGAIPGSTSYLDKNMNNLTICPQLTHLIFGFKFNKFIADCIPSSVKNLEFGWKFNNPIYGHNLEIYLPNNLDFLRLGKDFDKKINFSINNIKKYVCHLNIIIQIYLIFPTIFMLMYMVHNNHSQIMALKNFLK